MAASAAKLATLALKNLLKGASPISSPLLLERSRCRVRPSRSREAIDPAFENSEFRYAGVPKCDFASLKAKRAGIP